MVNVIYNDNIPDRPNNPSQDQPKMQTNTNSLRTLIQVDHVGFGDNHGGYHKVIHQETQTSVNTVAGVNQIFSGVPGVLIVNGVTTQAIPNNGDTQLYTLTGMGGLSQLTGNSAATNGFQWIGDMLMQWGTANVPAQTGSITLPVPFQNNFFNLQMTLDIPGVLGVAASIVRNPSVDLDKFFYRSTAIGASVFVEWVAIGN